MTTDPTVLLTYLLQIKDRVKGLQADLDNDPTMYCELKEKKKSWLGTYKNLVEQLEYRYFELTNKLN